MKPLPKFIQTCLLAILVFLISYGGANAQYPSFTKAYGHKVGPDAQNNSGFIIHPYYGNYSSGGNLDTGYLLVRNVDDGAGNIKIKVTATLRTGSVSVNNWSRTIGSGNERCTAVQWDSRDNTYILTGYKKLPNGRYELLLMKINSSGTPLWEYSFGSNIVNCANCVTNIANPNLFGTSILQVKNDPNGGINDFVIAGFVSKGDGVADTGSVKRCLIWRVNITTAAIPVITTKFLKVFHGVFYKAGNYEPTNYDVAVNVKEINNKGFMVEGSTKYLKVGSIATVTSNAFMPFFGLIPYAGGTAYTGPGTFTYAYSDADADRGRVYVNILPDYLTNTGYILGNYYDRKNTEIIPINLNTGLLTASPAYAITGKDSPSRYIVGTNIMNLSASQVTITGYLSPCDDTGFYYLFTATANKNSIGSSPLLINKFRSSKYIGYSPLAPGYDFFKTMNLFNDSFQSVITPINGILDSHLGYNDVVVTGPYEDTGSLAPLDPSITSSICLFTNRTTVTCHPTSYTPNWVAINLNFVNYRIVSNVDPMVIYKTTHTAPTYDNVSILDCTAIVPFKKGGIVQDEGNNLNVYPNPFENTIKFTNSDWTNFMVKDVLGKTVNTGNNSGIDEINVSNLPNGIYFLAVQLKTGQQKVFKITKR